MSCLRYAQNTFKKIDVYIRILIAEEILYQIVITISYWYSMKYHMQRNIYH